MKRFILTIPPVIAFAIFVFFYQAHMEAMRVDKEQKEIAAKQKEAQEAEIKKARKIEEDKVAEQEKAKRLALIAKQKEEERNKKEEVLRTIVNDTEAALADGKRLQAQIIKLQADIQTTRAARDKAQTEAMETKLDLEKARIDKSNAEFEIQRYTDMLANRMAQSQAMVGEILKAKNK